MCVIKTQHFSSHIRQDHEVTPTLLDILISIFFFILLRVFITKENERKIYSLIYFTHEREKILTTFLDRTVKNFANNWSISSAIPPWIESFPSLGAVGKHWKMEKLEEILSNFHALALLEIYLCCRMLLKDKWDCYCKNKIDKLLVVIKKKILLCMPQKLVQNYIMSCCKLFQSQPRIMTICNSLMTSHAWWMLDRTWKLHHTNWENLIL